MDSRWKSHKGKSICPVHAQAELWSKFKLRASKYLENLPFHYENVSRIGVSCTETHFDIFLYVALNRNIDFIDFFSVTYALTHRMCGTQTFTESSSDAVI